MFPDVGLRVASDFFRAFFDEGGDEVMIRTATEDRELMKQVVSVLTPMRQQLEGDITVLNLRRRASRAMARLDIRTVDELTAKTAEEILDVKNAGVTTLHEIREKLRAIGKKLKGD